MITPQARCLPFDLGLNPFNPSLNPLTAPPATRLPAHLDVQLILARPGSNQFGLFGFHVDNRFGYQRVALARIEPSLTLEQRAQVVLDEAICQQRGYLLTRKQWKTLRAWAGKVPASVVGGAGELARLLLSSLLKPKRGS